MKLTDKDYTIIAQDVKKEPTTSNTRKTMRLSPSIVS